MQRRWDKGMGKMGDNVKGPRRDTGVASGQGNWKDFGVVEATKGKMGKVWKGTGRCRGLVARAEDKGTLRDDCSAPSGLCSVQY